MSEFTPGPWRLDRDNPADWIVTADNGHTIAEIPPCDIHSTVRLADAHLIAAAPELYEALDQLVNWVYDTYKDTEKSAPPGYIAALSALAKADGQKVMEA